MQILLRTAVRAAPADVWAGFTRELFLALAPPLPQLHLHRFDGCERGDVVEVELRLGPLGLGRWVSHITDHGRLSDGGYYFVDESQAPTLPAPLRHWQHRHLLEAEPNGGTVIVDALEYRTAFAWLDALLYPLMWAQFAYRRPIYRRVFGSATA